MSDTSGKQHGRMPSDEQMDSLLHEFFRLEAPVELHRPFARPVQVVSAESIVSQTAVTPPRSRSQKFIVGSAMSLLALALLVFVQVRTPDASIAGGTNSKSRGSEVGTEKMMLVSPKGDAKAGSAVLTEDGVTLEEADTIELKSNEK